MSTATVGSRYQVVIPREVRKRVPLRPHSKVNIEVRGHGLMVCPVSVAGWRGIGKALANGKDATDYVRALRAEWGGTLILHRVSLAQMQGASGAAV